MCSTHTGDLDELNYLYGSADRVKVLSDLAPAFFVRHQGALLNQIILSLSQLTDSKQSCGHDNLTYTCLLDGLPQGDKHQALRADLERRGEEIKLLAEPIRNYRNKALAHYDKMRCLTRSTKLGWGITPRSIGVLLGKIADFLTAFDSFFSDKEMSFRFAKQLGDAEDLIERFKLVK